MKFLGKRLGGEILPLAYCSFFVIAHWVFISFYFGPYLEGKNTFHYRNNIPGVCLEDKRI